MEFQIEKVGPVTVIVLPGEVLDAGNSEEFKRDTTPLLESNSKIVFDMHKMRFVDSSGCGALLSCLRKARANGAEIKLCALSKPVKDLLKLIRMDKIFEMLETREEAIKTFAKMP